MCERWVRVLWGRMIYENVVYGKSRLAVCIPAVGWEANISSEDSGNTQAKIVNLSTGGFI